MKSDDERKQVEEALPSSICLDDMDNLKLSGKSRSEDYSQLTFIIQKCSWEGCKPDDEIDEFLKGNLAVFVSYVTRSFDSKEYN